MKIELISSFASIHDFSAVGKILLFRLSKQKLLTRFASIKVSSKSNSSIPSDWNNSDESGDDRILQQMADNRELVCVTIKLLARIHKINKYEIIITTLFIYYIHIIYELEI